MGLGEGLGRTEGRRVGWMVRASTSHHSSSPRHQSIYNSQTTQSHITSTTLTLPTTPPRCSPLHCAAAATHSASFQGFVYPTASAPSGLDPTMEGDPPQEEDFSQIPLVERSTHKASTVARQRLTAELEGPSERVQRCHRGIGQDGLGQRPLLPPLPLRPRPSVSFAGCVETDKQQEMVP